MRIGFVGLGSMGAPMATNLIRAGYSLLVHNRTREKEQPLVELGASSAEDAARTAHEADVVITMVGDAADVDRILFGPRGIVQAARPGLIVIDMSTIAPSEARSFAASLAVEGIAFLDAPVSGGTEGARDGTLTIFVGGNSDPLRRGRPVLEAMGRTITHFGASGSGQTAKAVNQVIVASTFLAVAEGLALGIRSGLEPKLLIDAISGGLASSWILEKRGPRMVSRNYPLGFKLALHRKDLRIALEEAARLSLNLPGTRVVASLEDTLLDQGFGNQDMSSIFEALFPRSEELGSEEQLDTS